MARDESTPIYSQRLVSIISDTNSQTQENPKIKILQERFVGRGEVKGHIFTQLSRTDRAFLYEVNTGNGIYYEVFKKKINHRYGCVSYPTSKAFGFWAWSYSNLEKAIAKINHLNPI